MATQSTFYDLEAVEIRFFLSTKPIASKSHVAIWIKGEDDIYRIQNESTYELINDNIVFPTAPSGKALELRVGDDPSDLVQAPTDIAIVSAIAGEIVIVADSVQDVVNVSDNIASVTIVSDNMTELLVISADINLVLLSKEYAINPEDVAITDNPTDFSSLHYSKKSEASAVEAQAIVDSVNFPAGLIMEWHSDRKPTGWLWCDGESYSVFSPTPSLAYDELYQVLVDPEYVMTTKPEDWDINYPDDPNSWYDPSFAGSVVTQAELDLTVITPDRRGLFVRGKDQAGSVIPARGLDSHGVVALDTVIPSQNKAHTHIAENVGVITGNGSTDDDGSASPDNTENVTTTSEGGVEAHPTYGTTNYIIRAKGSYNGDGLGSGGTGITPIASEIDYADTYNASVTNLQESTDDYFNLKSVIRKENNTRDTIPEYIADTTRVLAGSYQTAVGYDRDNQTLKYIRGHKTDPHNYIDIYDNTGAIVYTYFGNNKNVEHGAGLMSEAGLFTSEGDDGNVYDLATYALIRILPRGYSSINDPSNWHSNTNGNCAVRGNLNSTDHYFYKDLRTSTAEQIITFGASSTVHHAVILTNTRMYVILGDSMTFATIDSNGDLGANQSIVYDGVSVGTSATNIYTVGYRAGYIYFRNATDIFRLSEDTIDAGGTIVPEHFATIPSPFTRANIFDTDGSPEMDELSKYTYLTADGYRAGFMYPESVEKQSVYLIFGAGELNKIINGDYSVDLSIVTPLAQGTYGLNNSDYSFVAGVDNLASYHYNYMVGEGLISGAEHQIVLGLYNVSSVEKVVIGVGADGDNKLNGMTISDLGDVQAPNRLAVPNDKSLLTKDVADGLYHAKETGVSGSFTSNDGKTITVTNGIITAIV